jgi:hypothetical protein
MIYWIVFVSYLISTCTLYSSHIYEADHLLIYNPVTCYGSLTLHRTSLKRDTYEERQFDTRNGTMKAKFAYLRTTYCWCRIRNIFLVKLCTLWNDGATAGKSRKLFSRIHRSNVITLHWMSGLSQNLCLFGAFYNWKLQKSQGIRWSIRQMAHFCNGFFCQVLANSYRIMRSDNVMAENPLVKPEFGPFLLTDSHIHFFYHCDT